MSGVPSWATIGSRCVCINGDGWERRGIRRAWVKCSGPGAGERCTVVGHRFDNEYGWCLILAEYPLRRLWRREGYQAQYFRPLVDDKAQERDAAMFRKMLTVDQTIPVDA